MSHGVYACYQESSLHKWTTMYPSKFYLSIRAMMISKAVTCPQHTLCKLYLYILHFCRSKI